MHLFTFRLQTDERGRPTRGAAMRFIVVFTLLYAIAGTSSRGGNLRSFFPGLLLGVGYSIVLLISIGYRAPSGPPALWLTFVGGVLGGVGIWFVFDRGGSFIDYALFFGLLVSTTQWLESRLTSRCRRRGAGDTFRCSGS